MKKQQAVTLACVLLCALGVFGILLHLESRAALQNAENGILRVDSTCITEDMYAITGWTQAFQEGKTHSVLVVLLENPQGVSLYLPRHANTTLFINGQDSSAYETVYDGVYGLDSLGPTNSFELEMVSEGSGLIRNSRETLYIGTTENCVHASTQLSLQRMFVIGIDCAAVIFCLSLFLHKRSEKYLVVITIYALLTAWRTLQQGFPDFANVEVLNLLTLYDIPQLPGISPASNAAIRTCTQFLVDGLLRYTLLRSFQLSNIGIKLHYLPLVLSAYVVTITCVLVTDTLVVASWSFIVLRTVIHGAELTMLISGDHRNQERVLLLVAWTLVFPLWVVDRADLSFLIPANTLRSQIGLGGIFETLYVLAFLFATSGKFARRFAEANSLSRQLENTNKHLEILVKERTKNLADANIRLRKAQDRRSKLVSNMAHSLKTPLFIISGYAEMIKDTRQNISGKSLDYLATIQSNTLAAQNIVKNLLLASQLEEDQTTFHICPFDLSSLLTEIAEVSWAISSKKNIHIELTTPDDAVVCFGDRIYLAQAVQNLVDNAIECSDPDTLIRITVKNVENEIRIEIKDEGIGVNPADLNTIFERYYSKHAGQHRGSGLGLPIAMDIIKKHGGDIEVTSAPSKGSLFVIVLPKNHPSHTYTETLSSSRASQSAAQLSITHPGEAGAGNQHERTWTT